MKTIKQWLKTIEDPERREKALNNTPKSLLKTEEPTLGDALSCAFMWRVTPEGEKYWGDYVNQLGEE
jgi:hypothetical protein